MRSKNSRHHIPKYAKNNKKIKNKLKDLKNDLNNYNKLQKYNKLNPKKYMKNLPKAQRKGANVHGRKSEKNPQRSF